jgi:type I restriction enzyme S subunit
VKVRLGSILEEFKAKPPAGSNPEVLTLTERNGFVRQADRFNKRLATEDISGYKYIELDDFAFNPYLLWAGAIARNGRFANGVISPLYPTFRVTPGNYAGYVERLVLSQQLIGAYDNIAFGSVPRRRRSSVKDFLDLEIPALPPLDEQRRIAAILDKADELRTKRREALAHLDTLTQSIFHSMFGDPAKNEAGFEKRTIVELCSTPEDIRCGPFGTQLKKSEFTSDGVPLWGIRNVNKHFELPTEEFVSPATAQRLAVYDIRPADIVMTRKGTIGNCALYPDALPVGIMHSDLLRVRVDPSRVSAKFLSEQLHHSRDVERQIDLISGGAIMAGINVGKLKSVQVVVPPLERQQTFAKRVAAVERLKETHRKHLAELDALFASLQHRAFKGEL